MMCGHLLAIHKEDPMKQSSSKLSLGAWTPIQQVLLKGPQSSLILATDLQEVGGMMAALRDVCARNQWFLSLAAADPHRFLHAVGIELGGAAKQWFDQQRRAEGWGDQPDEFERIASTPSNSKLIRLTATRNGSFATPVQNAVPWSLSNAVGRVQALSQTSYTTMSQASAAGGVTPIIPVTEAGYSHAAPINYGGSTGSWDAVIQLPQSFLKRQYDVLFLAQVVEAIRNPGSSDVINYAFNFEGWMFLFMRCELRISTGGDELREVVVADHDEVGVYFPFTATTYSRWTPDDEWEETDWFTGTFTRWGTLVKESPIALAGQEWRRTWAADLANGWTIINLDEGPDAGREVMLDAAVNAYIASEMPLLPVTPTFSADKPLMTYPNSAGFTVFAEPDLAAVSLCFHEDAETLIDTSPFRHYILDHGRNLAIGISIGALEKEILDGLTLPMSEGSITIESVRLLGASGRLHVRSEGHGPLGIPFSHTADILLSLKNGQLEAEIDESTLNLPWWLWALNTLLLVPLVGLGSLITMAIANIIGSNIIGNQLEGLIDLSALQDVANLNNSSSVVITSVERVEINASGVFLKGNVEINIPQLD
jgi:hypothetical protein